MEFKLIVFIFISIYILYVFYFLNKFFGKLEHKDVNLDDKFLIKLPMIHNIIIFYTALQAVWLFLDNSGIIFLSTIYDSKNTYYTFLMSPIVEETNKIIYVLTMFVLFFYWKEIGSISSPIKRYLFISIKYILYCLAILIAIQFEIGGMFFLIALLSFLFVYAKIKEHIIHSWLFFILISVCAYIINMLSFDINFNTYDKYYGFSFFLFIIFLLSVFLILKFWKHNKFTDDFSKFFFYIAVLLISVSLFKIVTIVFFVSDVVTALTYSHRISSVFTQIATFIMILTCYFLWNKQLVGLILGTALYLVILPISIILINVGFLTVAQHVNIVVGILIGLLIMFYYRRNMTDVSTNK